MSLRVLSLTILVALAAASVARAQGPRAMVEGGQVEGVVDGPAAVFKGIPYAAAPVGPLRWAPPQPAKPWSGLRDATRFGAICPQPAGAKRLDVTQASEDCLTLDVWAPAVKPARPLPVMLWLHGGGYETGSGSDPLYDGKAFARDGVVLVTINYRLGVLGFFAHPSLTRAAKPGEPLANYGLMDQVAALAWVKRNIAAFGGDPANVTVFGESAGGAAVVSLLAAPSAKGLFQKAIAESSGFWFGASGLPAAEAEGIKVAQAAGADGSLASLRAIPAEKLVGLRPNDAMTVVDGRFLPQAPQDAFRSGRALDVPLIIGTNTGEGVLLGDSDPKETLKDVPAGKLAALYGDAPDDAARARAVFNDWGFSGPSRWVAAKEAAGAPAWLYRFGYVSPRRGDPAKGAAHGSELVYVFESERMYDAVARYPDLPDIKVAKTMHGCWIAFAKTGRPDGCTPSVWTAYSPGTDELMKFDAAPVLEPAPRRAQWDYQVARIGLDKAP